MRMRKLNEDVTKMEDLGHALASALLGNKTFHDNKTLCPSAANCSSSNGLVSYDIGRGPSYVAIVSSSLSCAGSLLILLIYCLFRDLRSSAQKIITFLAIADLISALGYIGGSVNFLTHFNKGGHQQCKVFNDLCIAQASLTSWSSLASFSWTVALAFHFYLVIVYNRRASASKLMVFYHILAWVVPLFIVVPLAATKILGYAPYAASNWCFVSSPNVNLNVTHLKKEIGWVLLAGKFWEILTYTISIYIYAHIITRLVLRRRRYQPLQGAAVVEKVERRLIFIPGFFLALRIWGTVQFFYSIGVSHHNDNGCIPKGIHIGFQILGYLQAVGDPGQGWGNAVVYVFFSPTVRKKLFSLLCRGCLHSVGGWLISVANSTHTGEQRQRQERRPSDNSDGEPPQVLHSAACAAPSMSLTVSSCDITEVECGPTPGAEAEPSLSPRQWQQQSSHLTSSSGDSTPDTMSWK